MPGWGRPAAVAASVFALIAWPLQVSADATVVSTSPRPGENLASAPALVTLRFSEQLDRTFSSGDVVAPDGRRFRSEPARDEEIVIPVVGGQPGVYRVEWVAISAVDGQVLHGGFVFGVGTAPVESAALEQAEPSATAVAVAASRWLEYLGLIATIGLMVVRRLAAIRPRLEWARPPMQVALAAALIGGLGVVGLEAVGVAGSVPGAIAYLAGPPGWLRAGRVAAEGLALYFCLRGVPYVAPTAVLAAAAIAFAGHAAGVRPSPGAIFTDALHVLSAGVWAGGIIAMAFLHPPGGWRGDEGRALLARFGRVALVAFAVTALTGVLRATEELTGVADLWTTSYGVILIVKSAGVIAMLVLSALIWRRGLDVPRIEAVAAVVVIAATALLAAYPLTPARVSDAAAIRDTAATSVNPAGP